MSNKSKDNPLEKIYTPIKIMDVMNDEFLSLLDISNITEFLEPSAGGGAMVDYLKLKYPSIPILSYDIQPDRDDIIKSDFLKQKIEYKKGRITFMNPPFTKAVHFIEKCSKISDYVITITSNSTAYNIDYVKRNLYLIKSIVYKKATFLDNKQYPIAISIFKKHIWDEI